MILGPPKINQSRFNHVLGILCSCRLLAYPEHISSNLARGASATCFAPSIYFRGHRKRPPNLFLRFLGPGRFRILSGILCFMQRRRRGSRLLNKLERTQALSKLRAAARMSSIGTKWSVDTPTGFSFRYLPLHRPVSPSPPRRGHT